MRYITSDTHFSHKNIILFEAARERFADVEEMNETIIRNWNAAVSNEDEVLHLGDFGLSSPSNLFPIIPRLNGRIKLVPGNHDQSSFLDELDAFPNIEVLPMMFKEKHHKKIVYFSHFPVMLGESRKNLFNIHGHIHAHETGIWNHLNVGLDSDLGLRYPFGQPIPFNDVLEVMLARFGEVAEHGL